MRKLRGSRRITTGWRFVAVLAIVLFAIGAISRGTGSASAASAPGLTSSPSAPTASATTGTQAATASGSSAPPVPSGDLPRGGVSSGGYSVCWSLECTYYLCSASAVSGSAEWLWTPVVVVNAPWGGSATGSSSVSVGSSFTDDFGYYFSATTTSTASSSISDAVAGETWGLFELEQWTLYSLTTDGPYYASFLQLYVNDPCTAADGAGVTSSTPTMEVEELAGAESITAGIQDSYSFLDNVASSPYYGDTFSTVQGLWNFNYASNTLGFGVGCGSVTSCSYTYTADQSTVASEGFDVQFSISGGSDVSVGLSGEFSSTTSGSSDTSYTYDMAYTDPYSYAPTTGPSWSFWPMVPNPSMTDAAGPSLAFYYTFPTYPSSGGGGGGGGCVAAGTPILTPGGYVPVQDLAPGQSVVEYNISTGHTMTGQLVSAATTPVTQVVNVNHGLLKLTPTDQPIFILNSTFEGWLHDPQNLTTADRLYDPVTGAWIPVTSVTTQTDDTTVYDVVTTGANTFVGNGVLMDVKTD